MVQQKNSKFKIALVNPFVHPPMWPNLSVWLARCPTKSPDTALVGLASMLDSFDVDVIDGTVSDLTFEEFVRDSSRYRIVGIRAACSHTAVGVHALAAAIKARSPETLIVIGGHHATLYHEEWFRFAGEEIDVVVRSEGEETFRELVEAVAAGRRFAGIAGITWRERGGEVRVEADRPFIEDLDSRPMPRFDLWEREKYDVSLPGSKGMGMVEARRGCPNGCGFCATGPMWRNTQRAKSVDRIVEELDVQRRLGIERFFFADDNINSDPEWASILCGEIAKRVPGITWLTMASARPFLENPGLAGDMNRAGCKALLIGYESSEETALSRLGKSRGAVSGPGDYEKVYRIVREAGMYVMGLFIFGHPGETEEELNSTFSLAGKICDVNAYQPYEIIHGTPNHPKRSEVPFEHFYRHHFLAEPLAPANSRLLAKRKLLNYFNEISSLVRYAPSSYPSQWIQYKIRNAFDVFKPLPKGEMKFTRILWDKGKNPSDRLRALCDETLREARALGERYRHL